MGPDQTLTSFLRNMQNALEPLEPLKTKCVSPKFWHRPNFNFFLEKYAKCSGTARTVEKKNVCLQNFGPDQTLTSFLRNMQNALEPLEPLKKKMCVSKNFGPDQTLTSFNGS